MRKSFLFLCILCLFGMLAPLSDAGEYIIGEGDVLVISVWGELQLGQTVRVRPDGKITMPAVGEVQAAAMTPVQLQTELTQKLKAIVRNPVVTVTVSEITNNKAYIFGSGVNSGVFSLTQRTTLMQLLCQLGQQAGAGTSAAAGTQPSGAQTSSIRTADLRNAYVLRNGKKIKENFFNLFINGIMSEDIVIEPNDAIYIPAHSDRNIYVMGAVTTPRSIAFRDGLTVMEAILESGGFTKFAKQNDTVIYRKELVIGARIDPGQYAAQF